MTGHLGANLHELLAQRRERPVLDLLWKLQSQLLAKKRHSGHVAGTSAYPPTGDIRWPMSAFHPIASALPPAPDVGDTPGECLKLTLTRLPLFRRM